jgi:hypothetical protein
LLLDGETAAVEVEAAPGEPGQLAAPHPRRRAQAPEREETVAAYMLEEPA